MIKTIRNRFISLSLRTQLLLMALMLSLPAISLIIYLGFEQQKALLKESIVESNRLVNQMVAEQDNQAGDAEQLLTALAQIPEIRSRNVADTNKILADIHKLNPQFGNIIVTNLNGVAWASALPTSKTFSVKEVRSFKNAVSSKRFSSGEYTVGKISSKRTIGFGYPILNVKGDVESVVLVNFNFDKINDLLVKAGLPTGSSFTLIDYKGTIVDRNLSQNEFIGAHFKDELFQRIKNGSEDDSFIGIGLSGTKQIISTHKLTLKTESTPYLYLSVNIPLKETLLKAKNSQFKHMAFLFPFLIAVIILVLTIGKRCFIIPINKLQEASKNLAQGNLHEKMSELVGGRELGQLGLAFDDMARQLSERELALHKSEREYRFLADNSADIIWRLDNDLNISYINPADERLRGFSKEEVLGKRLTDLMTPEDAEQLAQMNSERKVQEQVGIVTGLKCFEAAMFRKSGDNICVEVLSSPVRDEKGYIIGYHGVARDISRRKKIEEEREELITQLQSALAEIRTLSGMLPICSSCKKIRDDNGYWNQLESYISEHSDALFSHSYCPDCAEKVYEKIERLEVDRANGG